MGLLKVSSKSSPASVAGAIAGLVKDNEPVMLQCIGAGAVNQGIKAIAIARGFLIPCGLDITCAPTFSDIEIAGQLKLPFMSTHCLLLRRRRQLLVPLSITRYFKHD